MEKVKIQGFHPFPMPAVLVGANVNSKPNFLPVAFCGFMNINPPMLYVALNKAHYTNAGVKENKGFSVNVPSVEMMRGHRLLRSEFWPQRRQVRTLQRFLR